ncbi:MAG: hypothetical protein PHN94_13245, partial [Bacteroidales bacterium]|nr:hypothetical protein [Bacteroidales bacterium]
YQFRHIRFFAAANIDVFEKEVVFYFLTFRDPADARKSRKRTRGNFLFKKLWDGNVNPKHNRELEKRWSSQNLRQPLTNRFFILILQHGLQERLPLSAQQS